MVKIRLLYPEDKEEFVKICSEFGNDITLHKGSLSVDAKSLVGVMAFDCKFDCYLTVSTDDSEVIKKLETALSKYICEE